MAPPLATKANPVEFSEDTELREATVVGGSDQTSTVALMDLGWTFQLHSSPTSSKVIYLDFDGHTTTGTSFNNRVIGSSFYSPAYDINGNPAIFNNEELSRIQQIWQRVAADFAPFDVDVTTQAPPTDWLMKSNSTDQNYGIRAVITGYGPSSSTVGGIAIADSFNSAKDTPCFIYNTNLTGAAEAVSHEVGHTLGLSHDGTSSSGYYYGHGSGETSWAPIMGVGYNKNVTSWDNGTYYGSSNGAALANYGHGPNDMAVISTFNGFGYQLDQIGNDPSSAAALTVAGGVVSQFGRIETSLDCDFYSFQLQGSGNVNLKFDPYCYRAYVDRDGLWGGSNLVYTAPVSDGNSGTAYADSGSNLDLAVGLYSSSGSLLGSFNGAGLATTLAWSNLAAGTYYVKLDGVGVGNPTTSPPNGYNDYASVGNYLITGTISNALNSGTSLSTTTALAPSSSTPKGVISPSGTAAIPAAAPRDSLTGIASGSVTSMAFQSDPLLDPRFAATALGSAAPGFPAAKVDNLQEGLITDRAATTLLGAVSEPSRSPFAGDLQTVLGALGLATERATAERPTWALA
ncbi:zinc-dependent metalloprotease family protein [Vulcanococcus limneticus]|uniref:zinc-dependent metalloprotease family protein n=1 Tax=Vulcanococcus limneticus TaxID=2170428 RepID=UPI00398C11B1